MGLLFRKKIIFYVLGIVAIVVICMQGSYKIISGITFSVWDVICKLSGDELNACSIQGAFDSGVSGWIYILMPLIASIPSASCIMDEIQSKFYLYIEGRKGRKRYISSRFFYNIMSAGSITFFGLGIYTIIIALIFPLNPVYKNIEVIGSVEMSVWMLVEYIAATFAYMLLYAISVSLFVSLLVLIFQNLYFDLSVGFILNYMLKDFFMQGNIIYLIVIIAVMFVLYRSVWKIRGEKI